MTSPVMKFWWQCCGFDSLLGRFELPSPENALFSASSDSLLFSQSLSILVVTVFTIFVNPQIHMWSLFQTCSDMGLHNLACCALTDPRALRGLDNTVQVCSPHHSCRRLVAHVTPVGDANLKSFVADDYAWTKICR